MKNEKNFETTNYVSIVGTLADSLKFSHEIYGEQFFESSVAVQRLSGVMDYIPITISEKLFEGKELKEGDSVAIQGEFRSFNKFKEERSKLILHVFAKELFTSDIEDKFDSAESNYVYLEGFICKAPVYRTTPFKREICDALIAVNRRFNKSDYIPCICWGRNARYMGNKHIGDKLMLEGRIQSRPYMKKYEDGREEELVAYELSVNKMCDYNPDVAENKYEEERVLN